jgi:hypothetical protein
VSALDIKVTVSGGWVTLEGEVPWQYQKLAAEAAIRHVPGIKGITNLIAVRPHVEPTDTDPRKIVRGLAWPPGGGDDRGTTEDPHRCTSSPTTTPKSLKPWLASNPG